MILALSTFGLKWKSKSSSVLACSKRSAHSEAMVSRSLKARELKAGMVLDQDVKTREGALVLPKGHELSTVLVERLRQFAESPRLHEPIRLRAPADPLSGA